MKPSTLSGIVLSAAASAAAASLPTISAVGNKFFYENGTQFFIKGIAYQLSENDPLIDGDQCSRDASLMKTLGTNAIRVYHVDADADHSSCMSTFAAAGIYTLIDLDTFTTYILSPTMSGPSWNQTQFDHYAAVMDAFATYTNVLGFFVGNEVIATNNESSAAPYIKAAAHDMKAYRKSKKYRDIPVGYSAADIAELRPMLQDYLTCGGDDADTIDFFSLNSYEWCDPSTYSTSGYTNLQSMAEGFPVPIFFSETGCNVPGPRLFADQAAIFGPEMVNDWSGAIIYEWIQEANDYGLITYGSGEASDSVPRNGTPTAISPDFENLKSQWATLHPTGVVSSAYNAASSVSTRACPAATAGGWEVDGNVALPTLGATVVATKTGGTGTTATGTGSSASATGSAKSSAASLASNSLMGFFNREFTAAGAALAGVMIVFTMWL